MPLKSGKMTAKEAIFVGHMTVTGDPVYAAKMAGYSQPEMRGREMAKNDALMGQVRQQQLARLVTEGLPAAIDYGLEVIRDKKRSDVVRSRVMDRFLHYGLGAREGGESKEPYEMTPAQIQARIDALQRMKAGLATPVIEHEPEGPKGDVFG